MQKIIAAMAAAIAALALGGAAWASCANCFNQCGAWYPDDEDLYAACMNGCAFACID